jgi:hypothetical protein
VRREGNALDRVDLVVLVNPVPMLTPIGSDAVALDLEWSRGPADGVDVLHVCWATPERDDTAIDLGFDVGVAHWRIPQCADSANNQLCPNGLGHVYRSAAP